MICPVPKTQSLSCLSGHCLIAFNPIVMNCFEQIILHHLMKHTKPYLDPFQCACGHNRSTEYTTLTLLHQAYSQLEKLDSFVQILFINFSSAFSTTHQHLMAYKQLNLDVNLKLIPWIANFLANYSQTVHHQTALSSFHSISTGSPQGTFLSPIYTVHK